MNYSEPIAPPGEEFLTTIGKAEQLRQQENRAEKSIYFGLPKTHTNASMINGWPRCRP